MEEKAHFIIQRIKDFFKEADFTKAVIGLSGGVDSALTAKLAVMALGKENVIALLMPHEGVSSEGSINDAQNWARELGIEFIIVPINEFLKAYQQLPWKASEEARINLQARVRASLLYHFANSHKALVLGTGNKTELSLGYFTKYGDGAVDLLPIGHLYKTEVWEMAKTLDLPEEIIHKTPSAELKKGQTDETEIGMSYTEIDEILRKFEAGELASLENELKLEKRINVNRHKLKLPPLF